MEAVGMNRIVFLDRDGVINKKAPEGQYITDWEAFLLLPCVVEAIALLNKANYRIVVVTNQRGVARGIMTMAMVEQIHAKMCSVLAAHGAFIDMVLFCPHEIGTCSCRKPEIGMFLQAEEKLAPIDRHGSFMVGDSRSDIEAGQRYGVHTISLGEEYSGADYHCNNLLEAANYILRSNRN